MTAETLSRNNQPGDENTLLQRILRRAEDLATLEIVTVVGHARQDPDSGRYAPGANPEATMLTKIQLIEGDITSVYPRESLDGELQVLRELHQQREAQGMQIIQERLDTVKSLLKLINELRLAREKGQST